MPRLIVKAQSGCASERELTLETLELQKKRHIAGLSVKLSLTFVTKGACRFKHSSRSALSGAFVSACSSGRLSRCASYSCLLRVENLPEMYNCIQFGQQVGDASRLNPCLERIQQLWVAHWLVTLARHTHSITWRHTRLTEVTSAQRTANVKRVSPVDVKAEILAVSAHEFALSALHGLQLAINDTLGSN